MFDWLLPQASEISGEVDWLFFSLIALTSVIALGILAVIVYFSIRYHKSREPDRTDIPSSNILLEATWAGIPLLISIGIFIWGAKLYLRMYEPGGLHQDIYVVGLQWMWKIQHPQGPREINTLHVPVGRPIRLVMTSEDVIHSFYIPAFRLKMDVLPGRYTALNFQATRTGSYHLFCAEYCGNSHSGMIGTVEVMEPEAFQLWLAAGGAAAGGAAAGPGGTGTLVERGGRLFQTLGCSGCHGASATVRAPRFEGVYGNRVPLQGGGFATADDAYLRESIYFPLKKVVAGFDPVMPSFQGVASEEDVMALIAYIRSMGAGGKREETR